MRCHDFHDRMCCLAFPFPCVLTKNRTRNTMNSLLQFEVRFSVEGFFCIWKLFASDYLWIFPTLFCLLAICVTAECKINEQWMKNEWKWCSCLMTQCFIHAFHRSQRSLFWSARNDTAYPEKSLSTCPIPTISNMLSTSEPRSVCRSSWPQFQQTNKFN